MSTPTCVWSPVAKDFLPNRPPEINDIAWRRARAQQHQRCRLSAAQRQLKMVQGREATEQTDSLVMNLRQAKCELAIRDEETRSLRSAVIHLEHTLSQREREFHDTVLCLQGELPPPPRQPWLQKGVPSVELRLQVHRLQRSVAAKQDHIDHLNRQASLGFLREAREQAEEYRLEARRLARALTTATGGIRNGPRHPGANAGLSQPPTTGIEAPVQDYDTRAYQAQLDAGSERVAGTPEPPVPGVFTKPPSHIVHNERGTAVDPVLYTSSNTNDGDPATNNSPELSSFLRGETWPLAMQQGRTKHTRGSAAWESNGIPSPPRSVQWRHRETGGWLRSSRLPSARRPYSADIRGLMSKVTSTAEPAEMTDNPRAWVTSGAGEPERSGSPRSPRRWAWESGRGQYLSTNSGGFADDQRTSKMAETARLRLSARKNAAERTQALALDAESRRLQKARARRAHRMRLAQEKIGRYRAKRLRELDARLNRRFNTNLQAPIEEQNTVSIEDRVCSTHTEATGQGFDEGQKLRPSKPRRELETVVATADAVQDEKRLRLKLAEPSQSRCDSSTHEQDGHKKRRSAGSDPLDSFRGNGGGSGGGDDQGSFVPALGKPPLPPSRGSRSAHVVRKSSYWREGTVRSDPDGNENSEYHVPGDVCGDVSGDTWNYEDNADEVKTEAASNGSGVTGELWGDENEGGEICEESCTWDTPRGEEHAHLGKAWKLLNTGRSGGHYGGAIDDGGGRRNDFQEVKGIAGRGVNVRLSREFSSGFGAHGDRRRRVDVAELNLGHGNKHSPQQGKAPSWDESTTPQEFVAVRSEETNPSRTTPKVYPRRTEAFLTSDVEMSLHDSDEKGARRKQSTNDHNVDKRPSNRGETGDYQELKGLPREQKGFGAGGGEGRCPIREEDHAYRDSFELEAPPEEVFEGNAIASGDIREEKQVIATDEGLDGAELWEDVVTSTRTQSDGQTFGNGFESGSHISPRNPSVENTAPIAPAGVGQVLDKDAFVREGIAVEGVPAPEYLDDFVDHSDDGGDESRTPDRQGGSFFAISPSSEEEIETFHTSNADTEITSPPKRRPIRHMDAMPDSTASRAKDDSADGISDENPPGDESGRRLPHQSGSTSDSFDQHSLSPPHPRLAPEAGGKEEYVAGVIADDGEGGMSWNNHGSLGEKAENVEASAPSLYNSTSYNSASLYNLSPDSSSLPNGHQSTPSLVVETAPASAVAASSVNDQTPTRAKEEIPGAVAEKVLQSASSYLPSLPSGSSRHSLATEVGTVFRVPAVEEVAPVFSEASHKDNVVPLASAGIAEKMAGNAAESAFSYPPMGSDSDGGALSPIVETQPFTGSPAGDDLETSVRNENPRSMVGDGLESVQSVPPMSFDAGSLVDGECSPSCAAEPALELEGSSVDGGGGEARHNVVQGDTRMVDGEGVLETEETLSSSGNGSELDNGGGNDAEDDGYF